MSTPGPLSTVEVILKGGALDEQALRNGSLATPDTALKQLPSRSTLMPFEPADRILWALGQGMTVALGAEGWERIEKSLPRGESTTDLAAGIVSGTVLTVSDIVADRLKLVKDAITATLDFYSIVYDLDLWIEMLKVWSIPGGSGIAEFAAFMKTEHPDLYTAVTSYEELAHRLDKVIALLSANEDVPGRTWSVAMQEISGWMVNLTVALGGMLRPHVEELVANKGNAIAQGRVVGRVLARIIIEAVLLAMDLYSLVRGAAGLAGDVFVGLREVLTSSELEKAAVHAEQTASGIVVAGKKTARAADEAVKIYEELATEIKPYNILNKKTYEFNKGVRDVYGLKVFDQEYIGIRLDAHHIVEATWYDKFGSDFNKAFGWGSKEEMDTIAIHTEWHIRSGEKLAKNKGLFGAEKEPSLTKALQDHLRRAQTAPDGQFTPFTSLEQVFKAHAEFYKTYSPRLWPRLEGWFEGSMAKLKLSK